MQVCSLRSLLPACKAMVQQIRTCGGPGTRKWGVAQLPDPGGGRKGRATSWLLPPKCTLSSTALISCSGTRLPYQVVSVGTARGMLDGP